jgi:reactive intermediate/imine deaminase
MDVKMVKQKIHSLQAPQVIGPYSQAIQSGNTIYLSGQIPLDPKTMSIVAGGFTAEVEQVFLNLQEVCRAAEGTLNDMVKLTIYLIDLENFKIVNEVMARFFSEPYPARATIQVSALPKAAQIEIDGIMIL